MWHIARPGPRVADPGPRLDTEAEAEDERSLDSAHDAADLATAD